VPRACDAKVDPMTETKEVMVLEQHAAMRNFLHGCVHASGYDALIADSAHDAVKRYRRSRPQAVILSLGASRTARALRTISVLHAIDPTVPIIVISGHARAALIAQAMTLGASDFVTAPFDESDIAAALTRAVNEAGRQAFGPRDRGFDAARPRLVGSSPAMAAVRQAIERAAATDLAVLIRGESGTGKTLVAREIVAASPRWDQPFVKVNCAADDDELLDAEVLALAPGLFGGLPDLAGKFACATNGTLFLDEVDEISPAMQGKLLKILQDRESAHLRGKQHPHTNVRVIASSAGDLEGAVAAGRVRQELFFRINVLSIQLPPLRKRREDIPELADYFLKYYTAQYQAPYDHVTEPTMRQLMEHDWPGNVRELDNVIRRIVLLGTDASVTSDLRSSPPGPVVGGPREDRQRTLASDRHSGRSLKEHARHAAREAERVLILHTLDQTHWNRKEAAARLGISYKALLKKIKECDLQNT
jgi:two-component system, NtrC family, response regulator AtoC